MKGILAHYAHAYGVKTWKRLSNAFAGSASRDEAPQLAAMAPVDSDAVAIG